MRKKIRETKILGLVVEEFMRLGKPIGSEYIVTSKKLDISPATVRNYMVNLEKQSYLKSPHTSSGRVPTEKALKWFIRENLNFKKTSKEVKNIYDKIKSLLKKKFSNRVRYKILLKILSNATKSCGILCFEKNDFFIIGISNLISINSDKDIIEYKNLLKNIEDELDKSFNKYYDKLKLNQILILLGKDNPISDNYSLLCNKSSLFDKEVVLGFLTRFSSDYLKNLQLINFENYFKDSNPEIIFQDI